MKALRVELRPPFETPLAKTDFENHIAFLRGGTPSNVEALILFLFYCLAIHLIDLVLERRKQR